MFLSRPAPGATVVKPPAPTATSLHVSAAAEAIPSPRAQQFLSDLGAARNPNPYHKSPKDQVFEHACRVSTLDSVLDTYGFGLVPLF